MPKKNIVHVVGTTGCSADDDARIAAAVKTKGPFDAWFCMGALTGGDEDQEAFLAQVVDGSVADCIHG